MRDETRVLIVEDDRAVARLHYKIVSRVEGFHVLGVATSAAQARAMLDARSTDLLLLDLGLPGASGIDLLRALRQNALLIEAIAVTAHATGPVVRAAFQLGVVDYLVKPFRAERLQRALGAYLRRAHAFADRAVHQTAIDALRATPRWLPKDMTDDRLEEVWAVLRATSEPLTADAVGEQIRVSRVTARRYLEHLVSVGDAGVTQRWGGTGRPPNTYYLRGHGPAVT